MGESPNITNPTLSMAKKFSFLEMVTCISGASLAASQYSSFISRPKMDAHSIQRSSYSDVCQTRIKIVVVEVVVSSGQNASGGRYVMVAAIRSAVAA